MSSLSRVQAISRELTDEEFELLLRLRVQHALLPLPNDSHSVATYSQAGEGHPTGKWLLRFTIPGNYNRNELSGDIVSGLALIAQQTLDKLRGNSLSLLPPPTVEGNSED